MQQMSFWHQAWMGGWLACQLGSLDGSPRQPTGVHRTTRPPPARRPSQGVSLWCVGVGERSLSEPEAARFGKDGIDWLPHLGCEGGGS